MDSKQKKQQVLNPVENANFLSLLTFTYMFPIFKKSFKKELNESDLFEPLNEHKSSLLGSRLEKIWKRENKKHKTFALHLALFKLFGRKFFLFGFLRLFNEIAMEIVPPLCIGKIISYYENFNQDVSKTEVYLLALGIILAFGLNVFLTHCPYMGLMHLTMKMRVACSSLIYRKMLQLNRTTLGTTTGQIINLLSNDVSKFDQGFMLAHYVWIAPIHAAVGTYFLYHQIGISALFGVALLISFIPIQSSKSLSTRLNTNIQIVVLLGKQISVYRLQTAQRTDDRVRLINEIISGIQVIKMYCWEKSFGRLVESARKKEMSAIRNRAFIQGFFYSFEIFLARTAVFVSILGYVLMGSYVTAEKVFCIKAIYDVLRSVLILHFWISTSSIAETNISVLRIQKFLVFAESNKQENPEDVVVNQPKVQLENVAAKYSEENVLTDINLNLSGNQVAAIIGPVGCGKSTLINVLLKELAIQSGSVRTKGRISYSSQEPWLFSGSVRQNIIFNNEFNETRYRRVLQVCALETDLAYLPFGDMTQVGEKGRAVSGGQKARINLARCVYNESDIYLLDDPLSAVDAQVGKHLYEKCIKDFLKDKLCILVTHQIQYLNTADKIFLMKNGKIEREGTYVELQTKGLNFAELLQEFQNDNEEKIDKKTVAKLEDCSAAPQIDEEEVEKGHIKLSVYLEYFKAGGGTFMTILLLFIFVASQSVASAGDYYLYYWVNKEQDFSGKILNNLTRENETLDRPPMIYTYSGIILGTIVLAVVESLFFMFHFTVASVTLHKDSFTRLLNATMRFYNNNPSGRILNRFSKDIGYIDEYIPSVLFDVLQISLMLVGSFVLSFIIDYWLIIPAVIIIFIFYFLRIVYIRTSRSVKRIEGITRSPILGHANASIQGLTTIRNFQAQKILITEFDNFQDNHSSAWYLFIAANRTFGFWVDSICIIFFTIAILLLITLNEYSYGSDIGLVITQYTSLISSLQWELRQLSELENNMISVERLLEYKNVESEPDRKRIEKISKNSLQKGRIEFQNVSLKYNSNNVLKNLTFIVNPEEKIGIVGRTGAGKSSIITALFQLYPIEGQILIDGVDTSNLPLHEIRTQITIIPQEPILFSGNIRKNLDPIDEFSDENIWQALDQVELKSFIQEMSDGLHSNVNEGGTNFSVGQRQLFCLARALLRKNKILVLDEATANVDPQTDLIIQKTIREKFADCTVLTIAHRLHSVMDSDKILVMDDGCVREFDHPFILLQKQDEMFFELVQNTGRGAANNLERIAKEAYEAKFKLS